MTKDGVQKNFLVTYDTISPLCRLQELIYGSGRIILIFLKLSV